MLLSLFEKIGVRPQSQSLLAPATTHRLTAGSQEGMSHRSRTHSQLPQPEPALTEDEATAVPVGGSRLTSDSEPELGQDHDLMLDPASGRLQASPDYHRGRTPQPRGELPNAGSKEDEDILPESGSEDQDLTISCIPTTCGRAESHTAVKVSRAEELLQLLSDPDTHVIRNGIYYKIDL